MPSIKSIQRSVPNRLVHCSWSLLRAVTLLVVGGLAACSDPSTIRFDGAVVTEDPPVDELAPGESRIGIAGGMAVSDDGVLRLVIPAGALVEEQVIRLLSVPSSELTNTAGSNTDGIQFVYRMEPNGLQFMQPVTAELRLGMVAADGEQDVTVDLPLLGTEFAGGEVDFLEDWRFDVDSEGALMASATVPHFSFLIGESAANGVFRIVMDYPRSLESGVISSLDARIETGRSAGDINDPQFEFEPVEAMGGFTVESPFVTLDAPRAFASGFRQDLSCINEGSITRMATLAARGQFRLLTTCPGTEDGSIPVCNVTSVFLGRAFAERVAQEDRIRTIELAIERSSRCLPQEEPPPTVTSLSRGFVACDDAAACTALEQLDVQQPVADVYVPAWGGGPTEATCNAQGVCVTEGKQPVAFAGLDVAHYGMLASGDGAISIVDLETGSQVVEPLGGQDPFFGPNRHFSPLGVLPLVPDVEGGEAGSTLVSYGIALDGSSSAGRIQRYAPANPDDPSDFGRDFAHIAGNDFFLDGTRWGGGIRSHGGVLASDSGLRLFRFNPDPRVFAYTTYRFVDIGPVLSAFVTEDVPEGPVAALALQDSVTDGGVLQWVDLSTAEVQTQGPVGPNPRQIRCLGGLCVASYSGVSGETPSGLVWFSWDGQTPTATELGRTEIGGTDPLAQLIGVDLVAFDNDNLGVLAVGFGNSTVYELALSPSGQLLESVSTPVDASCANPGHGRWTADEGGLVWIVSCSGAGGVQVADSQLSRVGG